MYQRLKIPWQQMLEALKVLIPNKIKTQRRIAKILLFKRKLL
jgi:hypothetical protein